MEETLKIAVILSATDKMSAIINNATQKSITSLTKLQKQSEMVANKAFSMGRNSAAIGIAMAAPIVYATKKAIEFEDKMADVAKVAGVAMGGGAFKTMSKDALQLSKDLAVTADSAAGMMASLAAGGVEKERLFEISKLAGQMGVAFGMGADQAGDAFIKMKNGMASTYEQTKLVADSINKLSDSMASEAPQIVEFMAAGGAGVSNILKMRGQDVAAFGSTMISAGKSASESATIMERMQKGVLLNPVYNSIFKKAGGGTEGLLAVLKMGLAQKDPFAFFKKFGEYAPAIMQLAQNVNAEGGLAFALKQVATEGDYAGSVLKEFDNRSQTSKFKMDQAKASFNATAVTLGTSLLPALTKVIASITPIIDKVSKWIERNPELTSTIVKITAALAIFSGVVSVVSFVVGGFATAFNMFSGVAMFVPKLIQGINFALFAMRYHLVQSVIPAVMRFNAVLFANPIGLIVLAVVAVIAAITALIYYWKDLENYFKRIPTWAKVIAATLAMAFAPILLVAFTIKKIIDNLKEIKAFFGIGQDMKITQAQRTQEIVNERIAAKKAAISSNSTKNNSSQTAITYAPTISISGAASGTTDFKQLLKDHSGEVAKIVKEETRKQDRTKLGK